MSGLTMRPRRTVTPESLRDLFNSLHVWQRNGQRAPHPLNDSCRAESVLCAWISRLA